MLGMLHRHFLSSSIALATWAAVSVVGPRPAHASLILAVDLPELVTRSSYVAVVDVVSTRSEWDSRHEQILTAIELTIVESWKGVPPASRHITVIQPGGTVGDLAMIVHGTAHFQAGERAVVFLRGDAEHAAVVGMAQGKRTMEQDAASGRWMVHSPDKAGAVFVPAQRGVRTSPVFESRLRTLDEVRSQVRSIVTSAGGNGALRGGTAGGGSQ